MSVKRNEATHRRNLFICSIAADNATTDKEKIDNYRRWNYWNKCKTKERGTNSSFRWRQTVKKQSEHQQGPWLALWEVRSKSTPAVTAKRTKQIWVVTLNSFLVFILWKEFFWLCEADWTFNWTEYFMFNEVLLFNSVNSWHNVGLITQL